MGAAREPDRAVILRECRDDDVSAITRIYAYWVRHGLGTFEYEPPSESEMADRRAQLAARRFPYLVAEEHGAVLGYAYAGPYRGRPGYRFACEDSIYVAPEAARRGVGRALLSGLIPRCEAMGLRLMVAVIGDSGNAASIGLHAALGFCHAGVLPAVGWKQARWVDTVFMTRPLGEGASTPPETRLL
jgi:phosphinothricin acetyltransferase